MINLKLTKENAAQALQDIGERDSCFRSLFKTLWGIKNGQVKV